MLGDANISNDKRTKKKYSLRLRFNQGLDNEPYVEHLFAMFRDMVHPNTTTLSYVTNKNGDKTCSFNTRVNDAFIWYYEHLYYYYCPVEEKEKKKNIPVDLDTYFEGVNIGIALAYLYIDDGSLFRYNPKTYKEREKGKNIYLCLNDFPPADTQRFCDYINTKYGWHWKPDPATEEKPHKSGKIYIPTGDRLEFLQLIGPYLLSHWHYKITQESRFDPTANPARCQECKSNKIIYPSDYALEKWG